MRAPGAARRRRLKSQISLAPFGLGIQSTCRGSRLPCCSPRNETSFGWRLRTTVFGDRACHCLGRRLGGGHLLSDAAHRAARVNESVVVQGLYNR